MDGYPVNDYFTQVTSASDEWEKHEFVDDAGNSFISGCIALYCSSANEMEFSFDGVHTHGRLSQGQGITFDHRNRRRIYTRPAVGGSHGTLRIWAW